MRYFNKNQQIAVCFITYSLFIFFFIGFLSDCRLFYSPEISDEFLYPSDNYYIEVIGDVKNPGVYSYSGKPKISEVIAGAGGLRGNLSTLKEQFAGSINNGARLIIKTGTENVPRIWVGTMEPEKLVVLDIPININTLSQEGLMVIPGVGRGIAERIEEYRVNNGNFLVLDELRKIRGIGEKKLATIKRYCTAGLWNN